MRTPILVSSLLLVTGCQSLSIPVGNEDGARGLSTVSLSVVQNRNLDVLFVIDDSPSMDDKQVALAAAFPQMIDVLGQLEGGLPDLHIGVVTSDVGTSASDGFAPAIGQIGMGGCSGTGKGGDLQMTSAMTAPYLSDVAAADGTRVRNFQGELRDAFSQLARVGSGGCGFEQHLSAVERALGYNPQNAGFVRPSANLAVVILADEDDCSAGAKALFGPETPTLGPLQSFRCFRHGVRCDQDVAQIGGKSNCAPEPDSYLVRDPTEFVGPVLSVKPDPRMMMVAAVIGDPSNVAVELRAPPGGGVGELALSHSCQVQEATGVVVADPAVRIAAFLEAFPGHTALTSVCDGDLSDPLHVIGQTAKKLMGDPCVDTTGLADYGDEPGVQPFCVAFDVRDARPSVEQELPWCAEGQFDCFELVPDPVSCPDTAEHLKLAVRRSWVPEPDTWVHLRCRPS